MPTQRLLIRKDLRNFKYLITEGLGELFLLREAACNMLRHLFASCYSLEDSQVFTYEIRSHNVNHAMLVHG
jgi:hypothetical protein